MSSFFSLALNQNVRALRIIGSSVLSLCYVAAGRASAFVIGVADEGVWRVTCLACLVYWPVWCGVRGVRGCGCGCSDHVVGL